jgi:hypothetical protein
LSREASGTPEPAGEVDERDRWFLDQLIEDAWRDLLRRLREQPKPEQG